MNFSGIDVNQLPEALQVEVITCLDCHYLPGNRVVPCGWHENLVAFMAAIAAALQTMDTGTSNDA